VTIPEVAYTYIQLRRRPPEDEQGNARNMYRILINVLYVNKYEFCASSWRSTKVKVLQLVKMLPEFQETQKFVPFLKESLPLVPILTPVEPIPRSSPIIRVT
jgi:hypothetical protein